MPSDAGEDAEHDGGVVRATSARTDRGDEVGVVVVEAALHLVEEALLLFGKWHLRAPLRSGIRSRRLVDHATLYASPADRLGAWLGVRG